MTQPRVTVLYIAGTGRSGSTVLANILGEAQGAFAAGELRYLWERGIAQDRLCGCGKHFSACAVWQEILQQAFGDDRPDPGVVLAQQRASSRARHTPQLVAARWGGGGVRPAQDYVDVLDRLYPAIARVTGARVIVDSSKLPAYAAVLTHVPSVDLRVLHLVRDPRAAAYSWLRRKAQPDRGRPGVIMERQGPVKSTVLWDIWNSTAEAVFGGRDGYLRLRYEDFAREPRRALDAVLEVAGLEGYELPFDDAHTVRLGPNHSVAGNPNRLQQGVVRIRADAEWQRELPAHTSALVTSLSAPLLLHYGYPLRPHAGAEIEGAAASARADVRASTQDAETPHAGAQSADASPAGAQDAVTAHAGAASDVAHSVDVQSLPPHRRLARRLGRHWQWGRAEGFGRLVEEDQLDPVARARAALERRRWRDAHGVRPGEAVPVFIVGLQRSGTNMLTRGFEADPAFEVHNENDRDAFERFMLRDDATVRNLVLRSRHTHVLFKPLCDSHRIGPLLDEVTTPRPGRAIWAFRAVDGRARSAVAKFGDNNRAVMAEIAAGRGLDRWQAQALSEDTLEFIRSFDWPAMSAHSGAAMFWYARNRLYFELGLDQRDDLMLSSYDALVAAPEQRMRAVCQFLGTPFRDGLVTHISAGRGSPRQADIDARLRERCEALNVRLEAVAAEQLQRWGGG